MVQNALYFMLKALFVLEIFTFLLRLFGYVEKRFDKKAMVKTANNYNAHIGQYLSK